MRKLVGIIILALFVVFFCPLASADTWYALNDEKTVLSILTDTNIIYTSSDSLPWNGHLTTIKKVEIESGVTKINDYVLSGLAEETRIEFFQNQIPTISENAMVGTNKAVCRYFSESSTWTGQFGGTNITWIYLPCKPELAENTILSLDYSTEGWSTSIQNGAITVNLTPEQAIEMSYGAYKALGFYTLPENEHDRTVYEGWNNVSHITARPGFTGTLNVELGTDSQLRYLDTEQNSFSIISVNDPRQDGLAYMNIYGPGNITYHGNVQKINLEGDPLDHSSGSIVITGNVNELDFYDVNSNSPFIGDLTVGGNVQKGIVHGNETINIPNVGEININGIVEGTFSNINQIDPVIRNGSLNIQDFIPVEHNINMYSLDYWISYSDEFGSQISLHLYPKNEYLEQIGHNSVSLDLPDTFTIDNIVWGDDTSVTVFSTTTGGIEINGITKDTGEVIGLRDIDIRTGKVTINCPVDTLKIYNESYYDNGFDVFVDNQVQFMLFYDYNGGQISLGENGKLSEGRWSRGNLPTRYFYSVSGNCDLYSNGNLYVLSRNEGQTISTLVPDVQAVSMAAGQTAMMEIDELDTNVLSDAENEAILSIENEMLSNQYVFSNVIDVKVLSYELDNNGTKNITGTINTLETPVEIVLSTHRNDCVVYLDEYADQIRGVYVHSSSESGNLRFSINKSGKYVIFRFDNELTAQAAGNTNFTVVPGGTATLSVSASANVGEIYYQWYQLNRGENYNWFSEIDGANGLIYTTAAITQYTTFYCRVTDDYDNHREIYFYISIDNGLTVQAVGGNTNITVEPGGTATISVAASVSVGDIHYQWYKDYDDNPEMIIGATGDTYTTEAINQYTWFCCRVSDDYGSYKNVWFSLSVDNMFQVEATGNTLCYVNKGGDVTLSVNATCKEGDIYFSWRRGYDLISDATNNSITIDNVQSSNRYTCFVTDQYNNSASIVFTVITGDAQTIRLDTPTSAIIEIGGDIAIFSFTPTTHGIYTIESTSSSDTYVTLCDENWNILQTDDDGGSDNNFRLVYQLVKGHQYYYQIRYYSSSNTGIIPFTLTKTGDGISGLMTFNMNQQAMIPNNNDYGEFVSVETSDSDVLGVSGNVLTVLAQGEGQLTVTYENAVFTYDFEVVNVPVISLPSALITIEEEAFYGNSGAAFVELGTNVATVESAAFANSGLKQIIIHGDSTELNDDAFGTTNPLILCPIGSEAESFAKRKGFVYLNIQ